MLSGGAPHSVGDPPPYPRRMDLPLESARLAAWTTACLAGLVAPDDLADVAASAGRIHRVAGLDAADAVVSLPLAAADLRRGGARCAWLVWPAPGDAAGLPGPAEVNRLLLAAGQGVLVEPDADEDAALGLIPSHLGASGVLWTAVPTGRVLDARTSLSEADRALKAAVRESTDALETLDVARVRDEDAGQVEHARHRAPALELPPGYSPRARMALDTAGRLTALLDIAARDDGGSINRAEADGRRAVLRELEHAVRRAFVAAVNSLAEDHARAR